MMTEVEGASGHVVTNDSKEKKTLLDKCMYKMSRKNLSLIRKFTGSKLKKMKNQNLLY